MNPYDPKTTSIILAYVARERVRQEELLRAGKLRWNCRDPLIAAADKYCVTGEEHGEVGKAIHEQLPVKELQTELIQLAAVCVAWAESLEPTEPAPVYNGHIGMAAIEL